MRDTVSPRSIWWGRIDWLVFVPLFALLVSFWMYVVEPFSGPTAEALHQFYGMRHTAEVHSLLVLAGAVIILFYSLTLFLPRRLLFGRVPRPWTIAGAVLFILLSAATACLALANWGASFL